MRKVYVSCHPQFSKTFNRESTIALCILTIIICALGGGRFFDLHCLQRISTVTPPLGEVRVL